jgi:polygalacturonase
LGTSTTNLNLYKPTLGETGWDDEVNASTDRVAAAVSQLALNVKAAPFNAVGDGVANDTTAIQAAIDALPANGGIVFFPPGAYKVTTPVTVRSNIVLQGAGRTSTSINGSNIYVVATPTTGRVDRVLIQDMTLGLLAGSTGGGCLKVASDSAHGNWLISRVDAVGVAGCTDPVVHLDGFITCSVTDVQVTDGGGDGIKVTSTGFVSNAYSLTRIRVAACAQSANTYAGVRIVGGAHARIYDCTIESNKGYGVYFDGVTWATAEEIWFEDQWNTTVHVNNSNGVRVRDCKFHGHNVSAAAGADHIALVRSTADQRDMHMIDHNIFQDLSKSTVAIRVGSNVEQTLIEQNRGTSAGLGGNVSGGSIANSGKYTKIFSNDLDPMILSGTGTPEGVVTAPVGSLFQRSDNARALYQKLTGTGNTGWYVMASKGGIDGGAAVTGSRGGNAALASLLSTLASWELITDNTTA